MLSYFRFLRCSGRTILRTPGTSANTLRTVALDRCQSSAISEIVKCCSVSTGCDTEKSPYRDFPWRSVPNIRDVPTLRGYVLARRVDSASGCQARQV